MPGWVDPDGDPLLLLSVQNTSGAGSVAATPGGEVVYQHSDDGGDGDELVEIDVTVADTVGQVDDEAARGAGVIGAHTDGPVLRGRRHDRRRRSASMSRRT